MKPAPLVTPFITEFDTVTEQEWYSIIGQFVDAYIYQTWAYDAVPMALNVQYLVARLAYRIPQ